uniref:Reverse transcriptase zinc-binding domain-containing protein n=1 Tax=Tanacetum cinerariifolium TaxID=118510 RepID=A0A6L2KSI7_TANCI|nr:reverse transcriptase zinc-binding domain-containing protein [Tanacetum cinerariifolium]
MDNNETECSPSEVCLSDSDNALLIPTPWSDESKNEKGKKGMDDHMPDEIDGAKCEQLPNHVVKKDNLENLVCMQVVNHGGDELVDKGRSLKRKRVEELKNELTSQEELAVLQVEFADMKGLVKEMKGDLKYVTSLEDEFDETCLILDIQQEIFKTQFEFFKSESHSHVYRNEKFEQISSLENENPCLKKTIIELSKQVADVKEEMTKRSAV